MKKIRVNLSEIISLIGSQIIKIEGEIEDMYIDNLADAANVNSTTLDWINPAKQNKQEIAESSKANVMLVD